MKKFFNLFAFVLLLSFNANAQLPNGSIAPDFTATDINGVEYNLYSLLDQEKTVYLDFSATWCEPCWNYHNDGTLEALWENYGPETGADELYVFMIESDPATTLSDLNGSGSNTLGDWTNVEYPIIDDASISLAYEIGYYPSLFAICPNRTVIEFKTDTELEILHQMAHECPTPAEGTNNGAILAYNGVEEGNFCGDLTFSPTITFQNLGDAEITTASLGLYLNGTLIETQSYEGSLPTYSTTDIPFSDISFNEATELTISIETINGVADDVNDDYNQITKAFELSTLVAETSTIKVKVVSDEYGSDIYFAIRDNEGVVYLESGLVDIGDSGGGQDIWGVLPPFLPFDFEETIELSIDGCYEFVIFDDQGDGICCEYGDGFFLVTDGNDNVLAEGGTFTNSYRSTFFVGSPPSSVTAIEGLTELTVSPNPTADLANVTFSLIEATDINVTVYNIIGQAVKTINQTFNAGTNQFELDASKFANGVYFVTLDSVEGTSTVKFTVNK